MFVLCMCTHQQQYFKVFTAWHGGLETFFLLRILSSKESWCRNQHVQQIGPALLLLKFGQHAPAQPYPSLQHNTVVCGLWIGMVNKNYFFFFQLLFVSYNGIIVSDKHSNVASEISRIFKKDSGVAKWLEKELRYLAQQSPLFFTELCL